MKLPYLLQSHVDICTLSRRYMLQVVKCLRALHVMLGSVGKLSQEKLLECFDYTIINTKIMNVWLCWARYIHRYTNIFYMMNQKVKRESMESIIVLQFSWRRFTGRAYNLLCNDKI